MTGLVAVEIKTDRRALEVFHGTWQLDLESEKEGGDIKASH